jgi:hypothetical protein
MKEPIEAATQRGVGEAALVRRMCEIILGNTFGNEELDSLALLVGHHPDVLNASTVPVSAPPPVAEGEVGELVDKLRVYSSECSPLWAGLLRRAADILTRLALQPVSVSERPWEREGWCDGDGRCWCMSTLDGPPLRWWLVRPEPLSDGFVLPAHALPLPAGGGPSHERHQPPAAVGGD